MEAKINRSELMKKAWQLNSIMDYDTFSQALKHSWLVTKNEARERDQDAENEAIRQMWKEQVDAKRQAERQAEHEKFVASGLSLHDYTMSQYYGRGSGTYTGD